jgi:molecular chaperone DnaK
MRYHKVIGIDLGYTCSAVSVWDYDKEEVVVVPTAVGENTLPSIVGLDEERRVIVGRPAERRRAIDPENTVTGMKRVMGEFVSMPGLSRDAPGVPRRVRFRGRDYLPQEISAYVLAELKRQAETFLGEPVHDAVIAVPACFGQAQRAATQDAGAIARLNVRQLLDEPVAAAVSFGADRRDDGRLHLYAVYDLGRTTFNVSIVEAGGGRVGVLGTVGDLWMGGSDFDDAITNWAVAEIFKRHNVDLRRDEQAKARIKDAAERRKRELSAAAGTVLDLMYLTPTVSVNLTLTRAVFNGLIDERLRHSMDCLDAAIAAASQSRTIRREDIERVLLVGGSTRIPRVREVLMERMSHLREKDVCDDLNPGGTISRGAALVARNFSPAEAFEGSETDLAPSGAIAQADQEEAASLMLQDVTSHTLGILVDGEDFHPIFPKECRIPAEYTEFLVSKGGPARSLEVSIFQGEDQIAFNNTLIGKLPIPLPEPKPRGYWRFEVVFSLDDDGLLRVVVKRLNDGESNVLEVRYRLPPAPPECSMIHPPAGPHTPRLDENVQFTVYRPAAVEAGRWYPLLAFAHLTERRPDAPPSEPDPIPEVHRQAAAVFAEDAASYRPVTQDSGQAVPREGELTFVPAIAGVEFNPPRRTFLWQESVHREEFRMRAAASLEGQVARGRLTVFLGSIVVADISLSVRVGGAETPRHASATAGVYRKIFASYSHRDVAIVEECERYARAFGDQYVRDLVHLRTGEVWDDRLRRMIEDADVFQLFWSRNSLRSRFVRQEWEHALTLRHRGAGFIRPVYWEEPLPEDPEQGLPPDELRRLHFQRLGIGIPGGSAGNEVEELRSRLQDIQDEAGHGVQPLGERLRGEATPDQSMEGLAQQPQTSIRGVSTQPCQAAYPRAAGRTSGTGAWATQSVPPERGRRTPEVPPPSSRVVFPGPAVSTPQPDQPGQEPQPPEPAGPPPSGTEPPPPSVPATPPEPAQQEWPPPAPSAPQPQAPPVQQPARPPSGSPYYSPPYQPRQPQLAPWRPAGPPVPQTPHTARHWWRVRRGTAREFFSLARNVKWTETAGVAAVLLALFAASSMTAMRWWQRVPWRPLAATVLWGARLLAGVTALSFLLLLAIVLGSIFMSIKESVRRRSG